MGAQRLRGNRDKGVRRRLLSGLTSDILKYLHICRMQQEAIAFGYVETILGVAVTLISRAIASASSETASRKLTLMNSVV